MNSAKLNDWMQVIGIFALVASLIFVGVQLQQDRTLAVVDSMYARAQTVVGLGELVSNNNDVWVNGLAGEELSGPEKAIFQAIVESVEAHFVSRYTRLVRIGGPMSPADVVSDYAFAIYMHPGLRESWFEQLEYWQSRGYRTTDSDPAVRFREAVTAALSEHERIAPQLPADRRYAFW